MADWTTISSLATAGGTLILAIATFASVRSGGRAARTAERALQVGIRPLLVPSRIQDPAVKIMWVDRHWAKVNGGRASVELVDGIIYLAISLRNVGAGIAVLHGWRPTVGLLRAADPHGAPEDFRMQSRDLYIPPGDVSFWQGAVREPTDPEYAGLAQAIKGREAMTVDLLYGDHEGGQRAISRFSVIPREGDEMEWLATVGRHWNLDRPDPR
jgi:hypothetical protein